MHFESPEEAILLTKKRKALEEVGLRKKKRHSPDPNSVDFDKEGLLQEVNSMKEGEKVRISILYFVSTIIIIRCSTCHYINNLMKAYMQLLHMWSPALVGWNHINLHDLNA